MKKIAFALMLVMTVFVLSGCSKSNDKEPEEEAIVGGEDVTNPFLNPGGKIIDKGVNIVGAWAFCPLDTPTTAQDRFILINNSGAITEYNFRSPNWFALDDKGILHCGQKDIYLGEAGGWPCKAGKTMIDALLGYFSHDPENLYRDFTTSKNEKDGTFRVTAIYKLNNSEEWTECTLKNVNIDTYTFSELHSSELITDKYYLRRIKGFQE